MAARRFDLGGMPWSLVAGALVLLAVVQPARAGDARHGAGVFEEQCAECHSMQPGRNRKGPSLFGVVGRSAGGAGDYAYSDAMKACGLVWTPDKLEAYMASPRKVVPGCKMKYDGLADATARNDLIDYLSAAH